ncbi:MAG: hypothetical protein ACRBBN_11065 [Methyloligellaceae bacterium]
MLIKPQQDNCTNRYHSNITAELAIIPTLIILFFLFLTASPFHLHAKEQKVRSIELPEGFKYPNGITHSPNGTIIYVGSVTRGDIISISPEGKIKTVFKETEDSFAGTALRFDPLTKILWVASPDFVGKEVKGKIIRRPHRIAAIDISKGKVIWSAAIPDKGFANDIALDGKGGIYITDSFQDRVLHLNKLGASFTVIASGPLMKPGNLGPAGIVKLPNGNLIIGLWSDGALLHIELNQNRKNKVSHIKLDRAIENPDGLALSPDGQLLILEGAAKSGNGKLLSVNLKQNQPYNIKTLLDNLDTPLNLTVKGNKVYITEGRVRHFLIKDALGIKIPDNFRVIEYPINNRSSGIRNKSEIRKIARLPDNFYPESIAQDASGSYFLGSATQSSIIHINAKTGKNTTFITPGTNGLMSVQGLHIDEESRRLYACTANLGVHKTATGKSALTSFHLTSGRKNGHWKLPDEGFCNDITSVNSRFLLISDTKKARVLKFSPKAGGTLTVWLKNPLLGGSAFNSNGIAWSRYDQSVYITTFTKGKLFRIRLDENYAARDITELKLSRPLTGADALRVIAPEQLIIFENGLTSAGKGRITHARISDKKANLATLHEANSQPTSGLITGTDIVFATSHFSHLFGKDKETPPGPFNLQALTFTKP